MIDNDIVAGKRGSFAIATGRGATSVYK